MLVLGETQKSITETSYSRSQTCPLHPCVVVQKLCR